MAITFYYLSGSPFSWKVWLALEHKQLPYDLRVLSADAGDLRTPEFLALNPRGKVPVIVNDGLVLSESSAIVEYLEDRYPASGQPLWPAETHLRALARRIAVEGDGLIYPNVRKLVVELLMRKNGEPDAAAIDEARRSLEVELNGLAHNITGPYLMGTEPSIADFTLYPFMAVFSRVHLLRPAVDLGSVPPRVTAWMREVEALPYFAKTIPPHWRPV